MTGAGYLGQVVIIGAAQNISRPKDDFVICIPYTVAGVFYLPNLRKLFARLKDGAVNNGFTYKAGFGTF